LLIKILIFVNFIFESLILRLLPNSALNTCETKTFFRGEFFYHPVVANASIYFCGAVAQLGPGLHCFEISKSHKIRHTRTHARLDFSARVICSSKRLLPTQQTQATKIRTICGIRTRDPNNRPAADLRLRPRGHLSANYEYSKRKFPSNLIKHT